MSATSLPSRKLFMDSPRTLPQACAVHRESMDGLRSIYAVHGPPADGPWTLCAVHELSVDYMRCPRSVHGHDMCLHCLWTVFIGLCVPAAWTAWNSMDCPHSSDDGVNCPWTDCRLTTLDPWTQVGQSMDICMNLWAKPAGQSTGPG